MAALNPDRLWSLVQQQLKHVVGTEKYAAYLETAVLIEQQDDLWRIGVRDEEARAWLSNGSYAAVADTLSTIVGQPVRLEFFDLDLPPLERKQPKDDGRPSTPEAAWKATLGQLALQLSRSTFHAWLRDSVLLRVEGRCWVIGVCNDRAIDLLENRLKDTITQTAVAIYGQPVELVFVVEEASKVYGRGPEPPPNWEEPRRAAHPEPDPEVQANVKKKLASKKVATKLKVLNPEEDSSSQGKAVVTKREDEKNKKKVPTDGFVKVPRYALRFWQPILGKTAFSLWMALCEHYYFVEKEAEEWPDIKTLIGEMGDNNRAGILGREDSPTRQGTKGAISILEEHGFLKWRIEEHSSGNPRLRTHHFDDFVDEEDIKVLTPRQVAALLTEERQIEHALYMARFTKAQTKDFTYAEWCAETRWSYLLDED